MIVSWNWLKQYIKLDISVDELAHRLTMAGLNHESTSDVEGDIAIDLEVTSNRPDCLGHIGIAREAAAVLGREVTLPKVDFATSRPAAVDLTRVEIACPDLCPRYIARVVRGVKIGPSPDWLRCRLATCGVASINNVVDITNYVLLEASQPLHAFDFDKLTERRIVVRRARSGETITAINQKRYELTADMCVIADASRAVAVAGVMGGFDTEVSDRTTSLLIESAEFDPLAIRRTSRRLGLSSESSYRFIRGVDPAGLDWASRRCCQLIVDVAGGEVAEGAASAGPAVAERPPVVLRFAQLKRILGIDIDPAEARSILQRLGLAELRHDAATVEVRPPNWRRDLEREIDLVEEVGRIHGYADVPEDRAVPMTASQRTSRDRVDSLIRHTLTAAGFCEAATLSFVDQSLVDGFRPWSSETPLAVDQPSRRQENMLRQTLVPSLLAVRRLNESRGTLESDLFELARVYLPATGLALPHEPRLLALVTGRDPGELKGAIENVLDQLHVAAALDVRASHRAEFAPGRGGELHLGDQLLGYMGQASDALVAKFDLRKGCCVAEMNVDQLLAAAQLVPRYRPVPHLPASEREISMVFDEAVLWSTVESLVRQAAGTHLESVRFLGLYRGRQIPAGQKNLHFGLTYRAADRTLTREEVDQSQQAAIAKLRSELGGELRGV
jgi:phenylalanyl-tRNA synthetase beta chain